MTGYETFRYSVLRARILQRGFGLREVASAIGRRESQSDSGQGQGRRSGQEGSRGPGAGAGSCSRDLQTQQERGGGWGCRENHRKVQGRESTPSTGDGKILLPYRTERRAGAAHRRGGQEPADGVRGLQR